jgi:two-component system, OmpR family, sensor histidine kinase VicK
VTPAETEQSEETKRAAEAFFDIRKKGGRLRILTRIDAKDVAYYKELMKSVEIRHRDDVKGNFAVSDSEYMSSPGSTSFEPGLLVTVVYSNAKPLVAQNRVVFESLWNRAVPAEERIREIEDGTIPPRIEVVRDPRQIQRLYLDLIKLAKDEILLILPTANAFYRQERIGVIEALQAAATEREVRIRIAAPNSAVQEALQTLNGRIEAKVGRKLMSYRRILEANASNTVTVLVVDRKDSLVVEIKDDSQHDFDKANDIATYSTRNSTVLANVRFFERMWEDVELREREEVVIEKEKRSRKAAELLQDILAHDIRNYNQISMTSAEMVKGSLDGNAKALTRASTLIDGIIKEAGRSSELSRTARSLRTDLSGSIEALREADTLIDSIVKAIEGSSDLIDRAKRLGSIISQEKVELHPVDLEGSIRRSVALVKQVHPDRSIKLSFAVPHSAQVLADEMLEEAFTNVLSNSVNYTERDEVPVEVGVEEATLEGSPAAQWKITFTDHGKGIPDAVKKDIFTRYLKTASGTGLGLSIVYALVVERYSGKVKLTDRVEGDHTKGTRIEIWLPRAS